MDSCVVSRNDEIIKFDSGLVIMNATLYEQLASIDEDIKGIIKAKKRKSRRERKGRKEGKEVRGRERSRSREREYGGGEGGEGKGEGGEEEDAKMDDLLPARLLAQIEAAKEAQRKKHGGRGKGEKGEKRRKKKGTETVLDQVRAARKDPVQTYLANVHAILHAGEEEEDGAKKNKKKKKKKGGKKKGRGEEEEGAGMSQADRIRLKLKQKGDARAKRKKKRLARREGLFVDDESGDLSPPSVEEEVDQNYGW